LALEDNKKTLLVLRHGKSSWNDNSLLDHERPLNKRGRNQGSKMGKLLKELDLVPDFIISSTAKRAIDTAELIVEFSGFNGKINSDSSLYNQTSEQYIKVLAELPDNYSKVLIVGHNPSLENLIEKLTNRTELMKTCYLARIDINIKSWKDITRERDKSVLVNKWRPNEKNE
jgi:phosphohistidine phosphatase